MAKQMKGIGPSRGNAFQTCQLTSKASRTTFAKFFEGWSDSIPYSSVPGDW